MPSEPSRPKLSRRKLQLGAIVIGLIASVVVIEGIVTRNSVAAQLRERADAQAVPTVVVIAAGSGIGAGGSVELPGRIEAHSRAPIYARISGYLKSWAADIGTPVKSGQLLAEIETPDLDQQLAQAQAELASAKANAVQAASTAKRWQSLLASDAVSRQESEEKANELATRQAAVNALQANVDRYLAMKRFSRIVAPFDGVVTARSTDVGSLISVGGAPGSELFVVSDTRKLRVYVNLPQNYLSLIKRGTKARLSVPENPGKFYPATVQSLSQAISSGSGSMLIQLSADNTDEQLVTGGYANVTLELPRKAGVLTIPPSALIFTKAGLQVATVGPDSKVILKPVTVARDMGVVIELATGLTATDRVIESPPDGVVDGDVVRVAEPAAKQAAAPGKLERGK